MKINQEVQEYINKIESNTFTDNVVITKTIPTKVTPSKDKLGVKIVLYAKGINDRDVSELMRVIQVNPAFASRVTQIDLSDNKLTSITLPDSLTSLKSLYLSGNKLTSITLPSSLTSLNSLSLRGNKLISINIPNALTRYINLDLESNQLSLLSKIILNRFKELNVNFNVNIEPLQNHMPIVIDDEILGLHFSTLLESMINSYKQVKNVHNMIVRIGLPYYISDLIFSFIDKNQGRFLDEINYLNSLDVFTPKEQGIINNFEKGTIFEDMIKDYRSHVQESSAKYFYTYEIIKTKAKELRLKASQDSDRSALKQANVETDKPCSFISNCYIS